jgi:hypothetical protein
MTLDKEARAREAKRLLDEPLLVEAFAAVEREAFENMISASGPDADRIRTEMADLVKAARALTGHLQAIIVEGGIETRQRSGVA